MGDRRVRVAFDGRQSCHLRLLLFVYRSKKCVTYPEKAQQDLHSKQPVVEQTTRLTAEVSAFPAHLRLLAVLFIFPHIVHLQTRIASPPYGRRRRKRPAQQERNVPLATYPKRNRNAWISSQSRDAHALEIFKFRSTVKGRCYCGIVERLLVGRDGI